MSTQSVSRRRTHTRRLLVVTVLVGAVVVLVCWLRPARRGGPTLQAYNQVQLGMTQEEVEQLFGMPPGDYSTGPTVFIYAHSGGLGIIANKASSSLRWTGDEREVVVYFDQNGRTIGRVCWGNIHTPWWERARRWLEQLF